MEHRGSEFVMGERKREGMERKQWKRGGVLKWKKVMTRGKEGGGGEQTGREWPLQ